ncbi:hypothetical protein [Pseudorhodoferax sp. Leaf267]|uniref:hypothetical protein n=1 Tax=Pseudorhodoferax sp. Leaf267 TaxID=1736316 RepID=UPI0012E24E80|nr:hypothetical protein [Pseudorhodoferax sp. Leaf267]
MTANLNTALHLHLEDVLGELHYARRMDNLGRLVHVTYWDVRRWARSAHREALASRASDLICAQPQPSRAACLEIVDDIIRELERIQSQFEGEAQGQAGEGCSASDPYAARYALS